MQSSLDPAKASGYGRNSTTDAIIEFLANRLDCLVDHSIEIAKSNGYAPFTTTIRAAWVEAIVSVTNSLESYLEGEDSATSGPLATLDYAADPRFARMRLIARQHRTLGITQQMYLGLFKHFRNLYLAELADLPGGISIAESARVRDFFDETELSISADWNGNSDNQRLRELQERSRAITLDKDRYFAVFESLQNPAFLLDRQGKLVNANQASAEVFLGGDSKAGDIVYLRSMRRLRTSLQTVIDEIMQPDLQKEDSVWLDTVAGQRCFDIRTRALHDAVENTMLGHVVQLNDVTEHQRRTDAAQQSEQGMSRFLATMSHEIRTPLHSVLGAAELLRNSTNASNNVAQTAADHAAGETYLDVIESAGKALLQTLSNVLDYSKFENEPPVARPTLTDLFEEIRDFSRYAVIGRDVSQSRLRFEIDANVPKTAYIDWGKTQQVLSNLVSNSLKVDRGEGVVVSIRYETRDKTNHLRFEVRDTGPGIPETAAAALFRPYEHAKARDTGNGGSGLGLAISHYLVEAMEGRIGYENQPECTLVWFEIPLRPMATERNDLPAKSAASPASNQLRLCLLVDDDPVSSIVTTRQLEHLGLLVTRAATVQEAKRHGAEANFDVFVVDYLLPDGDGPSLTKHLRAHHGKDAKFLALTANVEALADGADVFDEVLAKPVGQTSLASAIFGAGVRNLPTHGRANIEVEGLRGLAPETVLAMIESFATTWAEFRGQIAVHQPPLTNHDLGAIAHRLAGSCAILGLVELEPVLRQLETQCSNSQGDVDLSPFRPNLDRDLSQLMSWKRLKALSST